MKLTKTQTKILSAWNSFKVPTIIAVAKKVKLSYNWTSEVVNQLRKLKAIKK